MKTIKLLKKHIIIEPHEIGLLKNLLDYAYHRLKKHHNSGIKGFIKLEDIEKLRNQLTTK